MKGEALVLMFKLQKIYVNPGSDCASKALKVFPAFCAIGISPDMAHGSIVFTMNLTNLEEEVDYALEELLPAVRKLRSFSLV